MFYEFLQSFSENVLVVPPVSIHFSILCVKNAEDPGVQGARASTFRMRG